MEKNKQIKTLFAEHAARLPVNYQLVTNTEKNAPATERIVRAIPNKFYGALKTHAFLPPKPVSKIIKPTE